MDDKFDETLFNLLKDVKTLPNFFDVVFGFLYRRTDFYHISEEQNIGVGLPKGVAENYVKKYFLKYAHANKIVEKQIPTENIPIGKEIEVGSSESSNQICVKPNENVNTLDSYNGATFENYSWSQTISDVDVQVKIPDDLTSRQLSVHIESNKISVKLKNSSEILLEGEFCQKCKNQESIWSIDKNILQIHIEKVQEMWWDCFIKSETKLDLSKMDCSRPFHELSEEAQAKIEELTWNQDRKRRGLPTTDQIKLEETLKKAWNAEGSPFTGEYDPSKVKLS